MLQSSADIKEGLEESRQIGFTCFDIRWCQRKIWMHGLASSFVDKAQKGIKLYPKSSSSPPPQYLRGMAYFQFDESCQKEALTVQLEMKLTLQLHVMWLKS